MFKATEKSFLRKKILYYFSLQVLLPASSLLQMSTVREACCKFLMRQLHPTNCLGIRSFAGNFNFQNHKLNFDYGPFQTHMLVRNCTRGHISLHCKTFKKSWIQKNFFSCLFQRWKNFHKSQEIRLSKCTFFRWMNWFPTPYSMWTWRKKSTLQWSTGWNMSLVRGKSLLPG